MALTLHTARPAAPQAGTLRWPLAPPVAHGGPDTGPPVRHDFSTNTSPCGPLPSVLAAVRDADRSRYPEPGYQRLREQLGHAHAVDPARVVVAASASEWIWRFTALLLRAGGARRVAVPQPGYGEYAAAAQANGALLRPYAAPRELPAVQPGELVWVTEPHSPSGQTLGPRLDDWLHDALNQGAQVVLDLAYAPMTGTPLARQLDLAWQLWSPNKACGLTGVRAAYAIAPEGEGQAAEALRRHAPPWLLGADGVALLQAFHTPAAQAELQGRRPLWQGWRQRLVQGLLQRGWQAVASDAPFVLGRPPGHPALAALWHAAWRTRGLKLRDAGSLGLPGWVRLAALPPDAQQALFAVCDTVPGLAHRQDPAP